MRRAGTLAALAILMAAGTWLGGWWAVPLVAGAWGAWTGARGRRADARSWAAPAGAVVAWGALLALQAARGPVGVVAARVGAAMGVPSAALVGSTLAFAALAAWPVALVAAAVAETVIREKGTSRRVEDPAARANRNA